MPAELTGREAPGSFTVFWAEMGGERQEALAAYTFELAGGHVLHMPLGPILESMQRDADYHASRALAIKPAVII